MNKIELYKKMYLIRKVEDVIIENYFDDEMKTPMHMSRGSEAIAVGVCSVLGDRGQYFGTYRSHALYLASGGDLKQFFAEMYGKKEGKYAGKAGSMHIASPETGHISSSAIVASNIPVAVGAAWANKMQKNNKIVVVFFGDGALDEGDFWESINIAGLWQLPILFVCEDNRLAVHTPSTDRHSYTNILALVHEFNVATDYEIATDIDNVCEAVSNSVRCIDNFKEPGFVHLEYYRYLEHVGVKDDTNEEYRSREGWFLTQDNDPVWNLRQEMEADDIDVSKIEQLIDVKVYDSKAVDNAKKIFGEKVTYAKTAEDALKSADACVIVTEWPEFSNPQLYTSMRGRIIIDGRRVLDPAGNF